METPHVVTYGLRAARRRTGPASSARVSPVARRPRPPRRRKPAPSLTGRGKETTQSRWANAIVSTSRRLSHTTRTVNATDTDQTVQTKAASRSWHLVVVSVLGIHWALNFLFTTFQVGFPLSLAALPLVGFATPVLCNSPARRWRRIAFCLCVFEVCISPLLWVGSLLSFMDPMAFRLRILGIPILTITSSGGQFLYFAARGLLFGIAAVLISSAPQISPRDNRAD